MSVDLFYYLYRARQTGYQSSDSVPHVQLTCLGCPKSKLLCGDNPAFGNEAHKLKIAISQFEAHLSVEIALLLPFCGTVGSEPQHD